MITLDAKSKKNASSSLLSLIQKNDKNKTPFSDLLKNVDVSTMQKDGKNEPKNSNILQNNKQIIENLKNNLKDETALTKDNEILELNEHLTPTLNNKEIKGLIENAKTYLRDKILSSDGYKQAQIKELPNTLEGLVKVAKLLDIDVSKITLQEVQEFSAATKEISTNNIVRVNSQINNNDKVSVNSQTDNNDIVKINSQTDKTQITQNKSMAEDILNKITQKPTNGESNNIVKGNENLTDKIEFIQNKILTDDMLNKVAIQDEKQPINIKELPIFKAQNATEYTTTEHLMQSKLNSEQKTLPTQKDRADEVLRTLLQTSKTSSTINENVNLGVEFSVDSAKVIAPKAKKDDDVSLADLLQNSSKKDDTLVSQDATVIKNNDALDVKINEAKQMIKYLSSDIKNAIDDYKSPFTRVKVQLNPQNLGEVDLTVVQRGNNLHINLSSNNAAINALAMNLNDLKVQLNNNGINNATFNFSSNSQDAQNSYSNQQQQQSGQNHQRAAAEYNYFDKEEQNEEILSSLEIVVPRYI